jgi:hypothetical protein
MIRVLVAAGALTLAGSLAGPATAQETFHGYDCEDDCHQAGYDWASRNNIADERDCDSDSQAFNERFRLACKRDLYAGRLDTRRRRHWVSART